MGVLLMATFHSSMQLPAVSNHSDKDVTKGDTLKVPSQFSTIAEAVEKSSDGDIIVIAPGKYMEKNIILNKVITITSEWKLTGDESTIYKTIIDSDGEKLFLIKTDGIEISGLKIINGDHTLEVAASVKIIHNHFSDNLDAISMEAGAGGYVAYNITENDIDDGLDIDIGDDGKEMIGSDVIIEYNTILNSHDDGIEIRLFSRPDQNVKYIIRRNTIIGSGNAGVQLISYDLPTGKIFYISDNIFKDCKTALGCMEGAKTGENLEGATKMDEPVFFYNNTIISNRLGATGGNAVYAFNNLVVNNAEGGFKRFGNKSIAQHNLFYNNGGPNFIEISLEARINDNLLDSDPQINIKDFSLAQGSPAINAGLRELMVNGKTVFTIPAFNISGPAPDLGAIATGWNGQSAPIVIPVLASAGKDIITQDKKVELSGSLRGNTENTEILWIKEAGPGNVKFYGTEKLTTMAKINQHGIYRLALTAKKGNLTAKDQITVRYIHSGSGVEYFAKTSEAFEIEAENYAYSYGQIDQVADNLKTGNSIVAMSSNPEKFSMLEFSVGMENIDFYTLWIKCKSSGANNITVHFNGREITQLSAPSAETGTWIMAGQTIRATGGKRQLLIKLESGTVEIDKLILTPDKKFIPQ